MKIERAIANLRVGRKDAGAIPEAEYTETIDLAIEALKRAKHLRKTDPRYADKPLIGED